MSIIYQDERLIAILVVLSLSPLFIGFSSPALVLYLHRLEYGPGAKLQIAGRVVGVIVAITVAFATGSYWALIASQLTANIITSFLSYAFAPYRPKFRLEGARDILGFAGWLTASRIITTANLQSDRFLIGGVLGKGQLGQYTVGGDISSMATYAIAGPLMQTMFGGFARLDGDVDRMRQAYLKGQQILVLVLLPFGFGISCVADRLVPLILGPGWEGAITVMFWIAPVVALQALYLPLLSLSMAMGQPKILVIRDFLNLVTRMPTTLAGAWYYGLPGAVVARAVISIVMTFVSLTISYKLVQVTVMRQIINIWRSLASAAAMFLGVVALKLALGTSAELVIQILHLAILAMAGAAIYIVSHLALWIVIRRPDGAESFILDLIKSRSLAQVAA